MSKRNILVLVEGEKTDYNLMNGLFTTYEIAERHQIVVYSTSIHSLYNTLFKNKDIDDVDIFLHLREHAEDSLKETIFDQRQRYTDIILIFDLDPQERNFSSDAIREMVEYFSNSTDMGKLYINYPMLEAFYHIKSVPDPDYDNYYASLSELKDHHYKTRVHNESIISNRKDFVADKENCNAIIRQNLDKAWQLIGSPDELSREPSPEQIDILKKQIDLLENKDLVAVLNTCIFYIVDYNPELIS